MLSTGVIVKERDCGSVLIGLHSNIIYTLFKNND
jgi:hypothetical protein